MKKGLALLFAASFLLCLFHFYFAEDHCPVHCPSGPGGFGHVHPHHGGAVCLCFLSTLMGPVACDLPVLGGSLVLLDRPAAERLLARPTTDITPPPRALLV